MYQQLMGIKYLLRTGKKSHVSNVTYFRNLNIWRENEKLIGFDDALDRTRADAFGRIVMAFTFHTGVLIDDVQNAVAFADRFSRAFGDARAAGDALFSDFHGHVVSPE